MRERQPTFPRPQPVAIAVLVLLLATAGSSGQSLQTFPAPAEVDYLALRLPWTSTNRNADELSNQIESLYLSLYNFGNLPVRAHRIEDTRTISKLAYDLGFVKGGYFPLGIDSILCDLNPHVCARDRVPLGEAATDQAQKKHVGGTVISAGRWRLTPGDEVRIVDLHLESDITFVSRTIPEGESARMLLEREGPDCKKLGTRCIDIVRKVNPYLGRLERSSDGHLEAVLPVERVTTMIPIRDQSVAAGLRGQYALFVNEEEARARRIEYAGPETGGDFERFIEIVPQIEQNLYKKPPNAPKRKLNSNFDNLHGESLDLYKLTRHPFWRKEGSVNDLANVSIPVGVIDYWVDTDHCHLAGKVNLVGNLESRQVTRAANCYEVDPAASEMESHGTHVVGTIIGGNDGAKYIGLYPQADLYFSPIEPDDLGDPLETKQTETDIFMMSQANDVRVINISWEYLRIGNNDPILRGIDMFVSTTLFVVASGNGAREMQRGDSGCIWDPACQSNNRHNVMSVVGLTASIDAPDVYEKNNSAANGSNYGTAFDIGATGQSVLSAVNGDRVGTLSGTSQAAPQVTAAAALIVARFKETRPALFQNAAPSPAQIKNRLMYAADVFPELLDSVYSGRLNIERALAINEVQVILDDASDTVMHSKIVSAPDMIICRVGAEEQQIPWGQLRRIATNNLSNSLVVFYEERNAPDQPQTARLERITDCELRTQTNPISFTDLETNEDVQRQLRDIVDLTMRF